MAMSSLYPSCNLNSSLQFRLARLWLSARDDARRPISEDCFAEIIKCVPEWVGVCLVVLRNHDHDYNNLEDVNLISFVMAGCCCCCSKT